MYAVTMDHGIFQIAESGSVHYSRVSKSVQGYICVSVWFQFIIYVRYLMNRGPLTAWFKGMPNQDKH